MRSIRYVKQKIAISVFYAAAVAIFAAWQIPCLFQYVWHIPCPGCGMTRAVTALLQGKWQEAFSHHAMVWSLPVLYAYFWFDGALFRRRWVDRAVLCGIAAGFLLVWVGKIAKIC